MQLSKKDYARKRIHNGCQLRIENSVTRDNCSASRGLQNSDPRDGIFNLHLTTIKDSYNLFLCFYRNEEIQMTWVGDNFDELKDQLDQHINEFNGTTNTKESVDNVTDSSKSNSDTKTTVNDRNKPQKTSAVNNTSSDKRKPETLKRQDAFEESTNVDKRKKGGNDESVQSKSKSCNIL